MNHCKTESTVGVRLSKQIALVSKFSRNEAEKLINAGHVTVNGKVVKSATFYVNQDDAVKINNASYAPKADAAIKVYAFHKPRGLVVTKSDEKNRKTIYSVLPPFLSNYVYIGRLDMNTEGLILLTNSGNLAHEMESPKNEFEREYDVRVFGTIDAHKIDRMTKGVSIDGLHYKAKSVTIKKQQTRDSKNVWLTVTLTTGKNREIRKLMEFLNLKVNRLIRTKYDSVSLGKLPVGGIIELHRSKLAKIVASVSKKCQKPLTL